MFLANAAEARQLTGLRDLTEAVRALAAIAPVAVVKDGARGALACRDGRLLSAAAPPAEVLDTTAAGDCFAAGLITARLRGADLGTALRAAAVCGSLSTTGYGSSRAPYRGDLPADLAAALGAG